jgi:transcriptional regulator with XRE-family HTH domain
MINENHRADYVNIGNNLRRIRSEKGYSQQMLSNMCDVERAKISRIENASEDIKISTLLKITAALEVKLIDLVREEI